MASSFSSLVNNLAVGSHKNKCKYGRESKKQKKNNQILSIGT